MNHAMSATSTRASHAARLAGYLAVGIAGSALSSGDAEAAVVSIDVGATGFNLLGTNAGLSSGGITGVSKFPIAGPAFVIFNGFQGNQRGLRGNLSGSNQFEFAELGLPSLADPKNFSASASIDWTSSFAHNSTYFQVYNGGLQTSADFGPGSYMGFRFSTNSGTDWNYGYLQITWNSTTRDFQIFSAAYESTANTGILAGAMPSAVPGAGGLMALMALGGGAFRRRGRAA